MNQVLLGRSDLVHSPTATRYNFIQGASESDVWNTGYSAVRSVIPYDCTIKNLYVETDDAPGAGESFTYTVMKNGSTTSLETVIADTATSNTDSTNTASFSAGDTVAIRFVPSSASATSTRARWSVEVETASGFIIVAGNTSNPGTDTTRRYTHPCSSGAFSTVLTVGYSLVVPLDGTITNFYANLDGTPGSGKSYTISIYKNGSEEASSVITIADTATAGSATGLSIDITPGDTLAISVVASGTPTSRRVAWGVHITPDTDGQSIALAGASTDTLPPASTKEYNQITRHQQTWLSVETSVVASGPTSYVLSDMRVHTIVAPGATATFAVRINGADGNESVALSSGTTGTDGSNTDTITSGDTIVLACTRDAGSANLTYGSWSFVQYIEPTGGVKDIIRSPNVIPWGR